MRFITQLINGISRVLQKLFKYFNSTIISTFLVAPTPVWSVAFLFNFKQSSLPGKSSIVPTAIKAGSSLYYCLKLADVFECLWLWHYYFNVFSICICVLFISLTHSVNRAQFLNVTFSSLLFALPAVFETGIVPFHKYVCFTVIT